MFLVYGHEIIPTFDFEGEQLVLPPSPSFSRPMLIRRQTMGAGQLLNTTGLLKNFQVTQGQSCIRSLLQTVIEFEIASEYF
ncbi:hypothetical protein PCANC_01633 [Puccinia coronata f. sp. avenae]|uniref:Uncharacterized protein n=1 Tax=Puccinia coronata f. sp. avenae TaxID=200324 RepID=A0A2N5W0Q3_9BASI|nr:hypothetical protein PCANC_01633 [Puccinia coronata f. sp. avenae]